MIVITTPTGIGAQVLDKVVAGEEAIRVIVRDPARLTARTREMSEGALQGMAEMAAAQNAGIYDHETRTPPFTIPSTGFRQWCHDVRKPAVRG